MIVAMVTIILLVLIVSTAQGRSYVTKAEGLISRAIAPVQKTLYTGTQYIKNFFGSISEIGTLKETNQELEEEIADLKKQQVKLNNLDNENERLKDLLDFQKENPQYEYIAADIVSIDPEVWFNVFVIDKGAEDGVEKNMAICVQEGLVGKVIEVADSTSKVLAISDPSSMVNGVISRTGDHIRMQGNTYSSVDGYVAPDAQLIPGDIIVTSGLGGVFPEDIILGEVESVEKKEGMLEKEVNIVPAVDFQQLKEVLILKKK